MILSLSKKVDDQPQHVILICDGNESQRVAQVITHLLNGDRPVSKFNRYTGKWRYFFQKRYLPDLLLAFPQATLSTGLQRRQDRAGSKALMHREVDPFEIPNLWDRKYDRPIEPFDYQYMAIADMVRFLAGEMDNFGQQKHIEHFLENDEMGLGKTFMILCALLMLWNIKGGELKVLVVVPKNGKSVWARENARFADFDLQYIDADEHKPVERPGLIKRRADITVVNPEMLRGKEFYNTDTRKMDFAPTYPDLFNFKYDVVVIDEYHRFGSPTSLQSIGLSKLQADRFLPASGTPYLTRPQQMWMILNRCWPNQFPDYDLFIKCMEIVDKPTGKVVGYAPQYVRQLKTFLEPRSIRRRKDQVLKGLPGVMPIDLPITLNREQRRLYNQIRDQAIIELESGVKNRIAFESTVKLRLKQACFSPELFGGSKHSAKIDELRAYIESMVASNQKAIVFSEWAKATRILLREFGEYNPAYVDGSVTGKKRVEQEEYFNNNPDCYLYIGTIGANREAISLGSATTVIFCDKDPSPLVNAQAAGRSAAGGLRGLNAEVPHITVVSMWGIDTYEEHVEEELAFRQGNFNAIVEADGGQRVEKREVKSLLELM